jgi:hypothetical protein
MTDIETTLKARDERYGSFEEQAATAQRIKAAMFKSGAPMLAHDQREALEHIATKISRILTGDPDYHDNWHDIEGYAKLIADRLAK